MPIVHVPEKGTKERVDSCKTYPPYGGDHSGTYTTSRGIYRSREILGTIWECPDCGYFLITVKKNGCTQWDKVRWYRISAKRIVNDIKRKRRTELCQ